MPDTSAPDDIASGAAARRAFSSLVSHTLNGVVHSITGPLALLSAEGPGQPLTPTQRMLVDVALAGAAQLIQLNEDIILVTRAEARTLTLEPERIPLTTLLREAIEQAQGPMPPNPPINIDPYISQAAPSLICDVRQTRRALAAIVENAIRFSPRGAPIAVEARKRGDWAVITIRDSGPGVSAAHAEHIFDALYVGEPAVTDIGLGLGMGLGLAVARVCAEAHGGSLTLEAPDRPGATFTLRLPLTPTTANGASR